MVKNRNGVFQSRVFIPADVAPKVGRIEVQKSLRTKDKAEARHRAAVWEAHILELIQRVRQAPHMSPEQLDQIVESYLSAELAQVEENVANSPPDWDGAARASLEEIAGHLSARLEVRSLGDALPLAEKLAPGLNERQTRTLAFRLLQAQHEAVLAEIAAMNGERATTVRVIRRDTGSAPGASGPRKSGVLLSAAIKDYIADKIRRGAWAPTTLKGSSGRLALWLGLMGDKDIGSITKADMTEFQKALNDWPNNGQKQPRWAGKAHAEILAEARAENAKTPGSVPLQSVTTKNMVIDSVTTFIREMLKREVITTNPAVVLDGWKDNRDHRDQRDAFTDEQIAALLREVEGDREKDPACYWVVRVMLLSGMRLEEATKLRACDLREDEGVLVLDVNQECGRLKNSSSVRRVPVHPDLVSAGLLAVRDAVAASAGPTANLWGLPKPTGKDARWSTMLSKRLATRRQRAGLPEKVVTESARNTFAQRLGKAKVEERVIGELLGHGSASGKHGITRRYIGRAELIELRTAVEVVPPLPRVST